MATLAKSRIVEIIKGAYGALLNMVNLEELNEEEDTVSYAIKEYKKQNPNEKGIDKIDKAIKIEKEQREILISNVEDNTKTFGEDIEEESQKPWNISGIEPGKDIDSLEREKGGFERGEREK